MSNMNNMNTNNNNEFKRVGTREEVFKGLAVRTAGGLKKDDIIEKVFGSRKLYISKKLSDKMKTNFMILKSHNPNFMKRIQKKTHSIPPPIINTSNDNLTNNTNNNSKLTNQPIQNQPSMKMQNISTNQKIKRSRTQKLSFNVKNNTIKSYYYPELEGYDINKLKKDLEEEEAIEDLGMTPREFIIQDLNDIDLNIDNL